MGRGTHRIERQVLELVVSDRSEATSLQARLGTLQRGAITDVLERVFDEVAGPDRHFRVDHLELDLGRVDPDRLEAELPVLLAKQLRRRLPRALRAVPEEDVDFESVALWLREGVPPWWADPAAPGLLAESVNRLLARSPARLIALLRRELRDEDARARFVEALDESTLAASVARLAPPEAGLAASDLESFAAVLVRAVASMGTSAPSAERARRKVWKAILEAAAPGGARSRTRAELVQELVARTAPRVDSTYADLFASLASPGIAETDAARELVELARATSPAGERRASAATLEVLERLVASAAVRRFEAKVGVSFAALLSRLAREVSDAAARVWVELLESSAARGADESRESARRIVRALLARVLADAGGSSDASAELAATLHALANDGAPDDEPADFSSPAGLYVDDAGLVLLAPFLARFFESLALLEEEGFVDEAGRERGVVLLRYLATGTERFVEHQLALPKLLCGVDPAVRLEPEVELSEAEREECENLLSAVVLHAPVLGHTSPDGLRGNFLVRPGLLEDQGTGWTLRVERAAQDVLLEGFPWPFDAVRLPWMDATLLVDW